MLVGVGIAITVVGVLLILLSPRVGLLMVWAWFLIRPQEFWYGLGGNVPMERIFVVALTLSYLLHRALWKDRPAEAKGIDKPLLAFLAVNYFSIVTSIWASQSLQIANDLAKIVLQYFLIVWIIDSEAALRKFLWVYLLCMAFVAGSSIYEYQTNPYYAQGIQRATSATLTWGDPNATAINLNLSLPLAFALFAAEKKAWKRALLLVLAALSIFCIVLTGSRTGIVLLCVILLITALRSSKRFVLIPAAAGLLLLGWALMPTEYQGRYSTLTTLFSAPQNDSDSAQMSAHGRIVGLVVAMQIFADRPLLGVGAGNFAIAFGSPDMPYSYHGEKGWFQPHNLPGQLLSELGLFGLATFAIFVWSMLRSRSRLAAELRHTSKPSDLLPAVAAAALTIVLCLFVAGLSSHDLYRYNWYTTAALVSVAARVLAASTVREPQHASAPASVVPELQPA